MHMLLWSGDVSLTSSLPSQTLGKSRLCANLQAKEVMICMWTCGAAMLRCKALRVDAASACMKSGSKKGHLQGAIPCGRCLATLPIHALVLRIRWALQDRSLPALL